MMTSRVRLLALSLAFAGLAHVASADPPDRVARISYVSGSVSFRPASQDGWSAAIRNYPLTVGDHLWTDRSGRVELELGATFVRVAPSTEFSLLNLDDRLVQLRITQGTAIVRVRNLTNDSVEIDTPNGAVTIDQAGFYRIDVDDEGGRTTVTTRSGRADVSAGDAAYTVGARQSIVIGDGPTPYALPAARLTDDFEDWSLARDRRVETSVSVRYVSPRVIGYADLDDYGVWQDAPGYGRAWYPRVRADWAPYRYGHWDWIEPWGWTWIDDEPWGFAPSHYGRWFRASRGWCWIPGSASVRPVYAPALVAFVGGAGWQASFGFGAEPVGWFPLGPREPYVPGYGASFGYLRAVNAPHVQWRGNEDVGRTRYVNRDVPGAFTAVSRDAFTRARSVNSAAIAVPRDAFRNATPTQTGPGRPARGDVGRFNTPGAAPPAAALDRSVVVRRAPSESAHARFRNAPQTVAPPRSAPEQAARPGQSGQPAYRDNQRPRQERVAPQRAAPQGRPQEPIAPRVRPQPERVFPQARPRSERAAPQQRVEPRQVAPQQAEPRRVAPERAAPSRPQPERVVPQERPRPERAAPAERPAPPARGGGGDQSNPEQGRRGGHKKDK